MILPTLFLITLIITILITIILNTRTLGPLQASSAAEEEEARLPFRLPQWAALQRRRPPRRES
jgi:hypothetical protein